MSSTLLWILLLLAVFQPVSGVDVLIPNQDHFYATTYGAPETVDPHWAYDTASAVLIQNVYEGLVAFDYESVLAGDIVGNLADSWTISEDGLTYTFHIDTSITFQNDATLSAEDVEYSFERGMVMDHVGGPMWMLYEPLTGRYSSRDWNLSDPVEVAELGELIDDAIVITDADGTPNPAGEYVQFNLAMPYAPFLQILAQSWGMILDKDWAIDQGCWNASWHEDPGDYTSWLAYNNPPKPGPLDDPDPVMMGTGPYIFEAIEWPDKYRLHAWIEASPGYRGGWPAEGCAGYVTNVTVENIEEWTDRELLFLAGDCDTTSVNVVNIASLITNWNYTWNVSPQRHPPYDDEEYQPGIRCTKELPMLSLGAVFFNYDIEDTSPFEPLIGGSNRSDLLDDIDFRKAFAYAFNYSAYLKDVFLGEATVPANPAIRGLPYRNPVAPRYQYSLLKVEQHLKAAWGGYIVILEVKNETVGTGDGAQTVFYLDHSPVVNGSETIYLDGEATSNYTIDYATGKITFTTAPADGVVVTADYTYTTDYAIDYATGEITFAKRKAPPDGVVVTADYTYTTDYAIDYATGRITFTTAPADGVVIKADYKYIVEYPGLIWEEGFDLHVTYNTGNEMRQLGAEMCEYVIEYLIDWTEGGTRTPPHVDIIPFAIPWAQYIPYMYSWELPAFVIGRLADYPDPHNFFHPFMHEYGDYTQFQRVQYGQSGILQKGTLAPILDTGDPDYPAGETIDLVAEIGATPGAVIDNDYVNGLIELGVQKSVSSERRAIYYELQELYHYECASFPIYQPSGRHWERDWVQGWYYNPISPWTTGPEFYFYHIWKGLDADVAGADGGGDNTVNIIDAGKVSAHWSPGPPEGPLGYDRVADISPVSELNGEDYIIRGADGTINIQEFTQINADWGQTVVEP